MRNCPNEIWNLIKAKCLPQRNWHWTRGKNAFTHAPNQHQPSIKYSIANFWLFFSPIATVHKKTITVHFMQKFYYCSNFLVKFPRDCNQRNGFCSDKIDNFISWKPVLMRTETRAQTNATDVFRFTVCKYQTERFPMACNFEYVSFIYSSAYYAVTWLFRWLVCPFYRFIANVMRFVHASIYPLKCRVIPLILFNIWLKWTKLAGQKKPTNVQLPRATENAKQNKDAWG